MTKSLIYPYAKILILIMLLCLGACDRRTKVKLPGYVDVKYTYISSDAGGLLRSLDVTRGQAVKQNQVLFSLDQQPESDERDAALARLDQAKADYQKATASYNLQKSLFDRKTDLYHKHAISKEEFEFAVSHAEEAVAGKAASQANLAALQASFNKTQWIVSKKTIYSPVSALVFDTYYSVGESVSSHSPVVSLIDPSQAKIIFYSYEPQLSKIRLNQIIKIFCDHCTKPLEAKIIFISPQAEYTPPIIYSEEVRAKLVYRIEALPLEKNVLEVIHPGQPVTVELTLN